MSSFSHLNHTTQFKDVHLPERLIYEETFPLCESLFVEFKQSFLPQHYARKYYETICSFLNASGGYLIFGIRDNDRSIQGTKMDSKQIDQFLLFVDNLTNVIRYQSNRVTNEDSNACQFTEGQQCTISQNVLFKTRIEQIAKSYYICIISCHPELNKKYCLSDGSVYTRTNAGTQKSKTIGKIYTQQAIDGLLKEKDIQHQKQLKEVVIQISDTLYNAYHHSVEQTTHPKQIEMREDNVLFLMIFFLIVCSVLYIANY